MDKIRVEDGFGGRQPDDAEQFMWSLTMFLKQCYPVNGVPEHTANKLQQLSGKASSLSRELEAFVEELKIDLSK